MGSDTDRLRFVGDIDAEPEPLRSELWALVMAGASNLDDCDGPAPSAARTVVPPA